MKNLTSDLLDVTKPENEAKNKQFVDRRSQELVLSIGKKEFALLRGDNTFRYVHINLFSQESRTYDL